MRQLTATTQRHATGRGASCTVTRH